MPALLVLLANSILGSNYLTKRSLSVHYPSIHHSYKSVEKDLTNYVNKEIQISKVTGFSNKLKRTVNLTDIRVQIFEEYLNKDLISLIFKDIKSFFWWLPSEFKPGMTEDHWGNPDRMLNDLINLLKTRNKTAYIPALLLIVIKRQIGQINYLCAATRNYDINVDLEIKEATSSLRAGRDYAKRILTEIHEIKALRGIQSMADKALGCAQKKMDMQKPSAKRGSRDGDSKERLRKQYELLELKRKKKRSELYAPTVNGSKVNFTSQP